MSGRLKFLAIFIGFIVDVGGSLLLGVILGIALLVIHLAQGMPLQEIMVQMDTKHLNQSVAFLLASLGIGGLGSLTGGFVTGWMAKTSRVINGFAAGVLSTSLGLCFWNMNPAWYNLLGCVITLGLATTGAYFADLIFGRAPAAPSQHIVTPL